MDDNREVLPLAGSIHADAARLTPGLIMSGLEPARLVEVGQQMAQVLQGTVGRDEHETVLRLLALLRDYEMRDLCNSVGLPQDGTFGDLYRRLTRRCGG